MRFWMEMNLVPSIIVLSFVLQGVFILITSVFYLFRRGGPLRNGNNGTTESRD